jgi:uncharacterized membrane protein YidH (DUF202 family)
METTDLESERPREKEEKKKAKDLVQFERNRASFERLQLAWIRTCLTLLAIGVGAYEYFYNRMESGKAPLLQLVSGRELGLFLFLLTFTMLLLSTIQHRTTMAELKKQYAGMRPSVALPLSYLLLGLTFFLSCLIIVKLFV